MKLKIVSLSIAVVFALGIAASGNRVSAQNNEPEPMVGAYGKTNPARYDVKKVARFAIKQRGLNTGNNVTLIRIVGAEIQVVSGANYRLVMRVRSGRRRAQTVTAVVYSDLKDRMTLTHWRKGVVKD